MNASQANPGQAYLFARATIEEQPIVFNGRTYTPDAYTGYLHASFSHSVPTMSWYGEAVAPATVRNNFGTIVHKVLNVDHRMRAYDPEKISRDRIIGAILDAQWTGGATENGPADSMESSPGIEAVALVIKSAEGVPAILGNHLSSRYEYTVSMEVRYNPEDSGFLIDMRKDTLEARQQFAKEVGADGTPPAWMDKGWLYIPVQSADEELLGTRNMVLRNGEYVMKQNRMRDRRPDGKGWFGVWRDQVVWWLIAGLEGPIFYPGLAVVGKGAEPTARITQMMAHLPEDQLELEQRELFVTVITERLQAMNKKA